MHVIPAGDGASARLAAAMLNVEHGALAYALDAPGDALAPLPAPLEPWPVVTLPPATARGLPLTAHWRAAVGLVFYTGDDAAWVRVADGALALMRAAGYDHLTRPRAAAQTPTTVLRVAGRVDPTTHVVHRDSWAPLPRDEEDRHDAYPARRVVYLDITKNRAAFDTPPAAYSAGAAFTWFAADARAYLSAQPRRVSDADDLNFTLASLLYDGGGAAGYGGGAILAPPGPVLADGRVWAPGATPKGLAGQLVYSRGHRLQQHAAVLLHLGGGVSLVSDGAALCRRVDDPPQLVDRRNPEAGPIGPASGLLRSTARQGPLPPPLAGAAAAAAAAVLRRPGRWECVLCEYPLGAAQPAVALFNVHAPVGASCADSHARLHQVNPPGAPLVPAGGKVAGVPLCLACWRRVDARCLAPHLRAVARLFTPPAAQGAAFGPDEAAAGFIARSRWVERLPGPSAAWRMAADPGDVAAGAPASWLLIANVANDPYAWLDCPAALAGDAPVVHSVRVLEALPAG